MASTFFKAGAGSATALLEYKAGGTGSYIPFRSVSVNASGATQDSGEAFILTPGDILGVNLSSGATSTNIWVSEVEFDETAALVPVRVTSGFINGNNTLYTVPTGKSALLLGAAFSGPGVSNSIVRYFNNTGAATNIYLYLVPSGGSAGTTNLISPTTNPVANQTIGLIPANATLSAGDSIVANVNSTSSSQIFYLNLLVF